MPVDSQREARGDALAPAHHPRGAPTNGPARRAVDAIGLTGGIGSGKSTVGQMLVTLGATLIDADQISREVTGPDGAAMAAIPISC